MLTTHRNLLDTIRDTRKTLYAVAAFYVVVGFIFTIVSLSAGALLGTFLGFLIISGTLATTAALRAVLRTDAQVSSLRETAVQVMERLDRIEAALAEAKATNATKEEAHAVDVAETGADRSTELAAATLDRDAFPRLVTLLDRAADEQSADSRARTEDGASERFVSVAEKAEIAGEFPDRANGSAGRSGGVASLNVQRHWQRALREGDLAGARRAFSALIEGVDHSEIEDMRAKLVDLQHRTERSLRRAVSECVASRDVDGLLDVMREIRVQLPGHPMADECAKLESALRRRGDGDCRAKADDCRGDHANRPVDEERAADTRAVLVAQLHS